MPTKTEVIEFLQTAKTVEPVDPASSKIFDDVITLLGKKKDDGTNMYGGKRRRRTNKRKGKGKKSRKY